MKSIIDRIMDYVNENGAAPSKETLAEWRKEAGAQLAILKEKQPEIEAEGVRFGQDLHYKATDIDPEQYPFMLNDGTIVELRGTVKEGALQVSVRVNPRGIQTPIVIDVDGNRAMGQKEFDARALRKHGE